MLCGSSVLTAAPVVVIAPDSFKGSLNAGQVAAAIAAGVRVARPDSIIRICPMADGGEGTLDAMLSVGGQRHIVNVQGAGQHQRCAVTGLMEDGSGIVETAEIVGITDSDGMAMPVIWRSTKGVGEAILHLLDRGVNRFFVALGGSSTNDAGAGLLVGLGLKLFDAVGNAVCPVPAKLATVTRVDVSGLDERLKHIELVAMSDVNNPLTGENGATAVFGPQKGVTADQVSTVDSVLGHFAGLVEAAFQCSVHNEPGSGAAGGLGFALRILGGRFDSGAEIVAHTVGLDKALNGADWLITGEGRSDRQTLHGKAPFVASQHASKLGVPTTLLSGSIDTSALPRLAEYFSSCFSPAPGPITLDIAIRDAANLIQNQAEQLTRLKFGKCKSLSQSL
jgi:glycerate kinase